MRRHAYGVSTRIVAESISERILLLPGKRILLDSALAELYGVTTRRLNEQVRRNRARFPEDFLLELSREEVGRPPQVAARIHGAWRSSAATRAVARNSPFRPECASCWPRVSGV